MIRTYSKLKQLPDFQRRYEYLKLNGSVGRAVFGEDRYLNQLFYRSSEWRRVRDFVIIRDNGFDLGCDGYEIYDKVFIHHMNPLNIRDIENDNPQNLDPEFLISTSYKTHLAIHYGNINLLPRLSAIRKPGDTKLW